MGLKRTWGARITAVGFIMLTLAGNAWLVQMIFATPIHPLILDFFYVGVMVVAVGGATMLVSMLLGAGAEPPESP